VVRSTIAAVSHSTAITEAVFLDTQVFETASFNLGSTTFAAFTKHLETGRLRLITTDVTVGEIRARIEKTVAVEVSAHRQFRNRARVLRSCTLPAVVLALAQFDEGAIITNLRTTFDEFLKQHEVDVVQAGEQK
jgi:hypothetical protein